MNSEWSARRRWAVAPRPDPGPTTSLNESRSVDVSDRSALVLAAETLNDKPDVAWSERTTAAVVASARLLRLSRWLGTAGAQDKESKFLILRRSLTVTSIINTSEIYENSSTTCFFWYAFDGLVRRTLSQRRPLRRSIDFIKSICGRVQRSGAHVVNVQLIFLFFFWSLLCENGRDPLPQTYVLRFSSFCELLRRPLNARRRQKPWRSPGSNRITTPNRTDQSQRLYRLSQILIFVLLLRL